MVFIISGVYGCNARGLHAPAFHVDGGAIYLEGGGERSRAEKCARAACKHCARKVAGSVSQFVTVCALSHVRCFCQLRKPEHLEQGGGQRNVHASVLGDPQARPYHVQTQGGETGA
jgi:hypothetical protein